MYKLTYIHVHGNTYQCQVQDECKLSCQNLHQSSRMVLTSNNQSQHVYPYIYFTLLCSLPNSHNNFSRWNYSSSIFFNKNIPCYRVNLTANHIMCQAWSEFASASEHSILLCSAVQGLMEQINDAFKSLWEEEKRERLKKMGVRNRETAVEYSPQCTWAV